MELGLSSGFIEGYISGRGLSENRDKILDGWRPQDNLESPGYLARNAKDTKEQVAILKNFSREQTDLSIMHFKEYIDKWEMYRDLPKSE